MTEKSKEPRPNAWIDQIVRMSDDHTGDRDWLRWQLTRAFEAGTRSDNPTVLTEYAGSLPKGWRVESKLSGWYAVGPISPTRQDARTSVFAIVNSAPRVDYVPTAFILRRGDRYWTVPQVDRRGHYWTKDIADALRFGDRAQADAVVDAFDPDPDDPVIVEPAPRSDSAPTPEKEGGE